MCMFDDGDGWAYVSSKYVTARKSHACAECGRTIEPGEIYERTTGRCHGADRHDLIKTCVQCEAARRWLIVVCDGWLYQGVLVDLEQHWGEYGDFGVGMLVVAMRRDWADRNGGRMTPEAVVALVLRSKLYQDVIGARNVPQEANR